MGAPTVYYYDDPGAPVLTNRQDAFYQIILACLVTGYGSKPAAGWSVVYDDWVNSGWLTLINSSQTGVLGIVRAASNDHPFLFVADGMIDATTPVNGRSGYVEISNTTVWDSSSAVLQRPASSLLTAVSGWCVVANDDAVFMMMTSSAESLRTINVSYGFNSGASLSFGRFRDVRGLSGEVGDFSIFGGAIGIWGDLNSLGGGGARSDIGTVSRDKSGAPASGNHYVMLSGVNVGSLLSYPSSLDAVVEFDVTPVSVFVSSGGASLVRAAAWQRSVVPQLKTNLLFTRPAYVAEALPDLLKMADGVCGDVYLSSKRHVLWRMNWNAFFLLSLEAGDWTY
jgi:uncharacterized membrane protein